MDTLLIVKDTVAVNIINATDFSKQCPQEFPTNAYDLGIALVICLFVFFIAIVVKNGFKVWQKAKFNYLKELDNQKNVNESARTEKEYQREKERNDREDVRKEKEYQREKERAEWDNAKKDRNVSESIKLICDAAKDKEGKIDKDILNLLLNSFNTARENKGLSDEGEDA